MVTYFETYRKTDIARRSYDPRIYLVEYVRRRIIMSESPTAAASAGFCIVNEPHRPLVTILIIDAHTLKRDPRRLG